MRAIDDREARFRDLYARTRDDIIRFAQRRAHASHAEDVTSETFLVAWRRFDELPPDPLEARAWVFGIARNCLLNANRGQGRRTALAVRLAAVGSIGPPSPEVPSDVVHDRVDLAAAWQRLDPDQQEVIALTAIDDLTSAEAARVLGISPPAYRVRLMRARRALQRHLATLDRPVADPARSTQEVSR